MTPFLTQALGVGAACCSMASFVPQLSKVLRERDVSAISLRMYAVTVTGFALWTIYGVRLGSWPLVGSNGVCLCLAGLIMICKLWFSRAGGEGGAPPPPAPPDRRQRPGSV
jgi:MtN3 and saliva related transmembrane protein